MKKLLVTCAFTLSALLCGSTFGAQTGWEWTKDEGWTRAEGQARATAKEQLLYAMGLEEAGDYYDAARQYFLLVRTYPNSSEAGQGLTRLAECLFEMENYYTSFKAIEDCIEKYPKSIHLGELLNLEFRIAGKFMQGAPPSLFQSRNPKADSLYAAVEVLEAIIKHDPFGSLSDGAYCELGMAYLELGKPRKAKDKLSLMISNFPRSPLVPLARYRVALANIQLGHGTLSDAQRRLKELKTEIQQDSGRDIGGMDRQAVEDNLQKIEDKEAEKMYSHGLFYEKRKSPQSYRAALFTYGELIKRYPDTDTAARAQERIKVLEKEGEPEKGLEEREFSLPNLPIPKVPMEKLAFWRKAGGEGEKKDTARKSGFSGVEVFPESKMQKVGDLVLDMEAEENRLKAFGSKRGYAPIERPQQVKQVFSVEDALTSAPVTPAVVAPPVQKARPVQQASPRMQVQEPATAFSAGVAGDIPLLPGAAGGMPEPLVENFEIPSSIAAAPRKLETEKVEQAPRRDREKVREMVRIPGTEAPASRPEIPVVAVPEGEGVLLNADVGTDMQDKARQLRPLEKIEPEAAQPVEEPVIAKVMQQKVEEPVVEAVKAAESPARTAIMPLAGLQPLPVQEKPEPVAALPEKEAEPAPEEKAPAIMPLAPLPPVVVETKPPVPVVAKPAVEEPQAAVVVAPPVPEEKNVVALPEKEEPAARVVPPTPVPAPKPKPEAKSATGGWMLGSDFE